jgi:hypothetical protein
VAVLEIQVVTRKQSSVSDTRSVYRRASDNASHMRQALKIDKMYCCKSCSAVFLFESDVGEHAVATGHREMRESYFD